MIRRAPSAARSTWITTSIERASWWRIAASGQVGAAWSTSDSRRSSASVGLFAWHVEIEPSWPVFIAWTNASTSSPRASPTTIRSGRSRSEVRTSCARSTAPGPSIVGGRASSRSAWGWRSGSSAVSSTITRRWDGSISATSAATSDVLPDDVAPATTRLQRACNSSCSRATPTSSVNDSSGRIRRRNRRIDSAGPSTATGGSTAQTLAPSASRASTIGEVRSTRRPSGASTRSISRSTRSVPSEPTYCNAPSRSIQISLPELTRTSSMPSSRTYASSSPSPRRWAIARSARTTCSSGEQSGARRRTSASTSGVGSPGRSATRSHTVRTMSWSVMRQRFAAPASSHGGGGSREVRRRPPVPRRGRS